MRGEGSGGGGRKERGKERRGKEGRGSLPVPSCGASDWPAVLPGNLWAANWMGKAGYGLSKSLLCYRPTKTEALIMPLGRTTSN